MRAQGLGRGGFCLPLGQLSSASADFEFETLIRIGVWGRLYTTWLCVRACVRVSVIVNGCVAEAESGHRTAHSD